MSSIVPLTRHSGSIGVLHCNFSDILLGFRVRQVVLSIFEVMFRARVVQNVHCPACSAPQGNGIVAGKGEPWRKCAKQTKQQIPAQPCMNRARPPLVHFVGGRNISVKHLLLRNSPSWTLRISNCSGIHVCADSGNPRLQSATEGGRSSA